MKKCKDHPKQNPYIPLNEQPKCYKCLVNATRKSLNLDRMSDESEWLFGKENRHEPEYYREYMIKRWNEK